MSWNVTNRLLEFSPAPESVVVNRLLIYLHKQIDLTFPEADRPPRQFTKTIVAPTPATGASEPAGKRIPQTHSAPPSPFTKKDKGAKSKDVFLETDDISASSQPGKFSLEGTSAFDVSQAPVPEMSKAPKSNDGKGRNASRVILFVTILALAFLAVLLTLRT